MLLAVLTASNESGDVEAFPKQLQIARDHLAGWGPNEDLGQGKTLLHHACSLPPCAHLDGWVRSLLECHASVAVEDSAGNRPLAMATVAGSRAVVATLLKAGAEADALNGNGEAALHLGACSGSDEALCELLEGGADLSRSVASGEHAGRSAVVIARASLRTATARLLESHDPEYQARRAAQEAARRKSQAARQSAELQARTSHLPLPSPPSLACGRARP